jgi:hypothetical protein
VEIWWNDPEKRRRKREAGLNPAWHGFPQLPESLILSMDLPGTQAQRPKVRRYQYTHSIV